MKKENLKRIILGLCFCMAAAVPSYAQWSFGVKAGVASSTVDIKHWDNKQKVGLLAGGVVSYELSENHHISVNYLCTLHCFIYCNLHIIV